MDDICGSSSDRESLDAAISRLAAAQHGVYSRSQAVERRATAKMIQHRVRVGRWERLYPGVYRLAGAPVSWRQELMAASFAVGHDAVASHRSAAALWQLPGFGPGVVELSVAAKTARGRGGIILHRVQVLARVDVTVLHGIRVTNPTRTLIDLAAVETAEALEEALDDALRRRLTTIPRLEWRLQALARSGRPGIAVIRSLVEARDPRNAVPQSVFETRLLRALRQARLPEPVCQHEVREGPRLVALVDFAYPAIRLAIEAEGYRWHSGRARWEHDLARRNALTALGWRIVHVTWAELRSRPDAVVHRIEKALAEPPRALDTAGRRRRSALPGPEN